MAEQQGVGAGRGGGLDDRSDRHRTELAVDQADLVAVVDQGAADAEQAERRQLLPGNPAADRRVGDVDQDYAHQPTPSCAGTL
jgi:hypothetical protein